METHVILDRPLSRLARRALRDALPINSITPRRDGRTEVRVCGSASGQGYDISERVSAIVAA